MNEYNTSSVQGLSSPARENLLIDGSECIDEECNRGSCNCINNEGGDNNNERCGTCRCLNSLELSFNDPKTLSGEYDERCLVNDLENERFSLDNGEGNPDNNYNCSGDSNYNCSEEYPNECQNQYHDNDYYANYEDGGGQQINYIETKGPEILHKSSKELYKAVAKQNGLRCKMTDTCR